MNVLLFGAGSKWGSHFTKYLSDHKCNIDLVTSSNFQYQNVNSIQINWNTIDLNHLTEILSSCKNKIYDLIFFNQNSGGGPNDKMYLSENTMQLDHWNKSFWVDVQLPYYVIKILNRSINHNTKVGWMLTGLINSNDSKLWKYAGYAAEKTSNLHIMRGFSQFNPGIYFCINPIWFPEDQIYNDCENIYKTINLLTSQDNGKVLTKNGNEWDFFKKIN